MRKLDNLPQWIGVNTVLLSIQTPIMPHIELLIRLCYNLNYDPGLMIAKGVTYGLYTTRR